MIAYVIGGLVLVAGITAGVAGIYFEGKRAGKDECASAHQLARDVAQEAQAAMTAAAASAIARINVKHTTIRQELQREVLTREVFRDCRSGPDAVRLLNASPGVAASAPGPAGDGGVPTARPAD